jgi:hypothetical protein
LELVKEGTDIIFLILRRNFFYSSEKKLAKDYDYGENS